MHLALTQMRRANHRSLSGLIQFWGWIKVNKHLQSPVIGDSAAAG